MMLAYVFGDRDHPCDAAPLLFGEGQQSHEYDSVLSASRAEGCTLVYLQAFDFYYNYFVVVVPPSQEVHPIAFYAYQICVG